MAGIPKKFTPATVTAILDATRAGASAKEAAQVAGISRNTLRDWLDRAEADKTGVFAMFAEEYGRAARYGATLKMNALLEAMK